MAKVLRLTSPKPYVPKEYDEQVHVFEWVRYCRLRGSDLIYATLNGIRLPIGLAVKAKQAGLMAGPLDINVDVARGGYHGLRIELKRKKGGRASDVQKQWIVRLREEGYKAEVCHGAQDAIDTIMNYLKRE